MQQMPKAKMKTFRRIFRAPPGQRILAADYSQIELRVVAELISTHFQRDSILRQAFARGTDAHSATAMAMTGKKDVTTEERQMAKPCNFGLLYRMGNLGFFNYVRAGFKPDITFDEARELRAKFFAGYPDMELWQREYSDISRDQGFTSTVGGRRWKWEWGAKSEDELDPDMPFYEDALEGFNGAIAVNFPVQGTAAEIMQDALCRIHIAIRDEPAELIATIHDEVLLLVADNPATVEHVGAIVQREMTAAFVEVFP